MELLDRTGLDDKWAAWIDLITDHHEATNHRVNERASFTPLTKPLSQSKMMLVTTAGAHLDDHEPFHVATRAGDASWRKIPHDVDRDRIRFTHTHYDTAPASQDPNVVLPIDRLDEAIAAGRLAGATSFHLGLMGFNPDPSLIAERTAPAVAEMAHEAAADVVLLVPG